MHDIRGEREERERPTGDLFSLVSLVSVAPPLRLAGAEEDETELNIVRGID